MFRSFMKIQVENTAGGGHMIVIKVANARGLFMMSKVYQMLRDTGLIEEHKCDTKKTVEYRITLHSNPITQDGTRNV